MSSEIQQIENYATMNQEDDLAPKYSTGYLSQIYWLFWRQLRLDLRNSSGTIVLGLQTIVIFALILDYKKAFSYFNK